MAQITPKGDAARQWLLDHPEAGPKRGGKPAWELDDEYAKRMASKGRKLEASGVTPDHQALRGHVLTPEHGPQGARPKLAEKVENYRTAKESGLTGEAPSAPSGRVTGALEGEPQRPLFHRRQRDQGHIPFGEGGEIYTRNHEAEARQVVAYAAELNDGRGERLTMQVYDCSRGQWYPVFLNPGHGQGINAQALLERYHEHGGSWEQMLLDTVNDASYRDRRRITHICQYEITILPRDLPAVKALKEQLRRR
jgi:hypothetical protein